MIITDKNYFCPCLNQPVGTFKDLRKLCKIKFWGNSISLTMVICVKVHYVFNVDAIVLYNCLIYVVSLKIYDVCRSDWLIYVFVLWKLNYDKKKIIKNNKNVLKKSKKSLCIILVVYFIFLKR